MIDVSVREDLGTSMENTCNRESLITVIVPAHNEASNIEKLFEDLKKELDVLQCYEVILVDEW